MPRSAQRKFGTHLGWAHLNDRDTTFFLLVAYLVSYTICLPLRIKYSAQSMTNLLAFLAGIVVALSVFMLVRASRVRRPMRPGPGPVPPYSPPPTTTPSPPPSSRKKSRITLADLMRQYDGPFRVVAVNEFDRPVTADYSPDRKNLSVAIFGILPLVAWTEEQAWNIVTSNPDRCEVVQLTRG